jgi:hypothetical protein
MQDTSLSGYMDGLYGYAMVLSRNPVVAADLVQEGNLPCRDQRPFYESPFRIFALWLGTLILGLSQIRLLLGNAEAG